MKSIKKQHRKMRLHVNIEKTPYIWRHEITDCLAIFDRNLGILTQKRFDLDAFLYDIEPKRIIEELCERLKREYGELTPEEKQFYITGNFSNYLRSIRTPGFWQQVISPANLINQIDYIVLGFVIAGAILMEVPGDIGATFGLTFGALALSFVYDALQTTVASRRMYRLEQERGLHESEASFKQHIKYGWPVYLLMVVGIGLWAIYILPRALTSNAGSSYSDAYNSSSHSSSFNVNSDLSVVSTSSPSHEQGGGFWQNALLTISVLLPFVARKINSSFMNFRIENIDTRSKKHQILDLLKSLCNRYILQEHNGESASHCIIGEQAKDLITRFAECISSNEVYLPPILRTALRELVDFEEDYNRQIKQIAEQHPRFTELNATIQRDLEQQRIALQGKIEQIFVEYLQNITEKLRITLASHIVNNKSLFDAIIASCDGPLQPKVEHNFKSVLRKLAIDEGNINGFIEDLNDRIAKKIATPTYQSSAESSDGDSVEFDIQMLS